MDRKLKLMKNEFDTRLSALGRVECVPVTTLYFSASYCGHGHSIVLLTKIAQTAFVNIHSILSNAF
jgi:hypothetical protein